MRLLASKMSDVVFHLKKKEKKVLQLWQQTSAGSSSNENV
jgi:hypothetical protein